MDPKKLKEKLDELSISLSDQDPKPDDNFLCSLCRGGFKVRDLHIVPSFHSDERRWTGAYRCPGDRGVSYELARIVLYAGGLSEDEFVGFFETVERWGPPMEALCPFVNGKPLQQGALEVLRVLEEDILRLKPSKAPLRQAPAGAEPVWLMADAVLACLIAPRGHSIDTELIEPALAGKILPVIVDRALYCAKHALRPEDTIDVDRWTQLLRVAEFEKFDRSAYSEPAAQEIEHWRELALDPLTRARRGRVDSD
jgi:hypothetical protein